MSSSLVLEMNSLEKQTLIERFVRLIPLPYTWASLVWTFILGLPGGILVHYLDTGQVWLPTTPGDIFNNAALLAVLFYVFYIARYLRLRILRAEQHIVPILTGGEREYNSAIGRVSSKGPVIILAVIFATFEILAVLPIQASFSSAWLLVQLLIVALGLASFVWEYSVFNWGLHKLGSSQLQLRSYLVDRTMGTKPVGNAALSSTVAYFGGLLLTFLLGTSNVRINGPGLIVFTAILLVLGVVMFFLPLNSLHRTMHAEKARNVRELNQEFLEMSQETKVNPGNSGVSKMSIEDATAQLVRLKEYELREQRLARTPTWPFDIQVIAKLTTIVLSVTAVLLTRIITDYLIRI